MYYQVCGDLKKTVNYLDIQLLFSYRGKKWCYVGPAPVFPTEPSSCRDKRRSSQFDSLEWSALACQHPEPGECPHSCMIRNETLKSVQSV